MQKYRHAFKTLILKVTLLFGLKGRWNDENGSKTNSYEFDLYVQKKFINAALTFRFIKLLYKLGILLRHLLSLKLL